MATAMTTFRFDRETLSLIDALAARLQPAAIGRPLTRADVVRHALRILDAQTAPEAPAAPPKKIRKKNADTP